ncbi:MAG: hypothetical protein IJ689_03845 [Alphaproteobacteria bacterium]|nr:hypothetical protein [Alphaproteobacteria bacterium]
MNKYILMLGVAAVSIGSYCAYADNSATMTVTATIAHDVSLNVTQDLDFGTITINPADDENTGWTYNDSGEISYITQGFIVSADDATVGTFTANIPNPSACSSASGSCGGLRVIGNSDNSICNLFGGSDCMENICSFVIKYTGSNSLFKVYPSRCDAQAIYFTAGSRERTLTISYTAS